MAGLCEGGNEPSGSLKAICQQLIMKRIPTHPEAAAPLAHLVPALDAHSSFLPFCIIRGGQDEDKNKGTKENMGIEEQGEYKGNKHTKRLKENQGKTRRIRFEEDRRRKYERKRRKSKRRVDEEGGEWGLKDEEEYNKIEESAEEKEKSKTHRHDTTVHDVIRLLIPALYKNQSDSLMAADGDCHHLCKLMAPVRHRWSINDVIGGIRNTLLDLRTGREVRVNLHSKHVDAVALEPAQLYSHRGPYKPRGMINSTHECSNRLCTCDDRPRMQHVTAHARTRLALIDMAGRDSWQHATLRAC
ncbi:hypothetical protein ANN_00404 [Periplaneta americana]|uniref:Uncharacterized protein n=1 Tax=Periplaneta americana TaxID=6978 RepID=A0ABQ8TUQ8_PERAM|nr:hypothetical protein ANN_00404 [Periplaneta americana]